MQPSLAPDVAAANDLTRKWCAAAGSGDFVLSGCGVWPLLALLAPVAAEPTRTELATAAGVSADSAHPAARTLLARIEGADAVRTALGVWVRDGIALDDNWIRSLPPATVAALRGRADLDEWAVRHTDGLIDRFPVEIDGSAALAVATAVVARTPWTSAFYADVLEPATGPWRGHRGPALARYDTALGNAALLTAETPMTRVVVRGAADLDVHLLLGPDAPAPGTPATVLAAGLDALDGSVETRPITLASTGPGLLVREVTAIGDALRVQLPPFDIRSAHDLLEVPALFGLRTATVTTGNRFPGLSPTPLALSGAGQHVRARFTAEGFDAAAVSAVVMAPTGMPPKPTRSIEVAVSFDRPFGFLAVHRPTGLVIVAGWVATPGS
ncbi:serpin family protein [Nocardia spumae]|uniref:serpin family protein n=1 Tax=Nocardia spumae TaxID=2887190 RepID=UPI001D1506B8|nr:serpin family protein [Nocardia spumae]